MKAKTKTSQAAASPISIPDEVKRNAAVVPELKSMLDTIRGIDWSNHPDQRAVVQKTLDRRAEYLQAVSAVAFQAEATKMLIQVIEKEFGKGTKEMVQDMLLTAINGIE